MLLTILPFLAAAAMSVPDPDIDFSRSMFRSKPDGNVYTDLLLDTHGRVEQCKVVYSEGSSRDNERYCERAIGRDAGEPAIGPGGDPTYGMAHFDLIVRPEGVPNARVPSRPAEIELTVGSLPADFGRRMAVTVAVFVHASGTVLNCERLPHARTPASYGSAACRQLQQEPRPVIHNAAGEAVAYMDNVDVNFVVEAGG
jgi:hypothetical protein